MRVGEIRMFAGNFVPEGWVKCDGQLLPIAEHQQLFARLRTRHGGDGRTNFGVPDLRRSAPLHFSNEHPLNSVDTLEVEAKPDRHAGAVNVLFIVALRNEDDDGLTGEIRLFAGKNAPRDWTACNGAFGKMRDEASLFSVIGTRFKEDVPPMMFALPDLERSMPVGARVPEDVGKRVGGTALQEGPRQTNLALSFLVCLRGKYPGRGD